MCKFYIGQPVAYLGKDPLFDKNETYHIVSLQRGCKCAPIWVNVGVSSPSGTICTKCNTTRNDGIAWKHEKLFAPLDNDISELTDILSQKETA